MEQFISPKSRIDDYADLDLDFVVNPGTKDVNILVGDDAIKRSLRNLILTNFYDKPFRPDIGSNVTRLLFENVTPLTMNFLREAITEVIANYEPRVELKELSITFKPDNNGFDVVITYIILNRGEPVVTSLFLERLR
jgi:phage baseplate assembly protein W